MASQDLTRRRFLRLAAKTLAAGAVAGAGTGGLGYWGGRFGVMVERPAIWLPNLAPPLDGLTIAHLSDLHHSESVPVRYLEQVVAQCNSLQPDMVVLTGDYVTNDAATFAAPCAKVLRELRAPLGCFATLGNHDHWTEARHVAFALERAGIRMLLNDGLEIQAGLWLLGVDDVWQRQDRLPSALRRLAPAADATKILLAHEPEFADEARQAGIDLQLSGHSHGGQIRVPGVGALVLPRLGRRYDMGLYRVGELQVYTTRGIGVLDSMPVRVNCPPEITLLTLRRGLV
jgi:predicted MPP superfamily phosphohydrolase